MSRIVLIWNWFKGDFEAIVDGKRCDVSLFESSPSFVYASSIMSVYSNEGYLKNESILIFKEIQKESGFSIGNTILGMFNSTSKRERISSRAKNVKDSICQLYEKNSSLIESQAAMDNISINLRVISTSDPYLSGIRNYDIQIAIFSAEEEIPSPVKFSLDEIPRVIPLNSPEKPQLYLFKDYPILKYEIDDSASDSSLKKSITDTLPSHLHKYFN